MPGPLHTLKVIEMAGLGPCPLAGQLLADLGADVLVIDKATAPADPTDINRRGKRSIALNLKSARGRDIAIQLITRADILIEGFRPGVMERLGLGPTECQALNPKLIYGRMTGWGQTGPLAQTAGHDINYLALSGALHAIGTKDTPPIPPLNLVADYGGGTMFLLLGVLSALFERGISGRGQVVDAAMVDGVPAMMGLFHSMQARGQWTTQREDNWLDGGAPFYRCYETADGKAMSVGALEPQFFGEFLRLMGYGEADIKAEIATQNDKSTWAAKRQQFTTLFKTKTRAEWETIFANSDACVAPVLAFSEVKSHTHNVARGVFVELGGVVQAVPAPRFDRSQTDALQAPRRQGADTVAVLRGLGLSEAEIAGLEAVGAVAAA